MTPDDTWRVVYLLGTPRCGSTLLGNALGSLPGAHHVGELDALWSRPEVVATGRRCGCGTPIGSCEVWAEAMAAALGVDHRRDPEDHRVLARRAHEVRARVLGDRGTRRRLATPGAGSVAGDDDLGWYLGVQRALYAAVAERTGARVLVDSSKSVGHLLVAARVAPVVVVHLVRDPRGVVLSRQRNVGNDAASRSAVTDLRVGVADTARWVGHATASRRALGRSGLEVHTVAYDDLARHPREVLARLARIVDLVPPVDGPSASFVMEVNHTAHGNKNVRFARAEVAVRPDDAWRRELRGPARAVASLAVPLERRLLRDAVPPTR